ncbi:hypothetical protein FBU30_002685 [Linnemannia zychae]|nr:hypothetical protein FBU30_002685 [Linnemannia zychae]
MDDKDAILVEITEKLLLKRTLAEILEETYKLQIGYPTFRKTLTALRTLIGNIIRPLHGSKGPSEGDCIALWSSIFCEGLPLTSHLTMHLGEQGCAATALSKSKLASTFEIGTIPRKCDSIMCVDTVEIGNFEYKRTGSSKQEVACPLRKNIKINEVISLELEKNDSDYL